MGEKFPPANEFNPKGFYEDIDFFVLDDALLSTKKMNPYHHEIMLKSLIRARHERGIPWGIKNPWMRVTCGAVIAHIQGICGVDPVIVTPERPLPWVVASLMNARADGWEDLLDCYREVVVRDLCFDHNMRMFPDMTVHKFFYGSRDIADAEVLKWLGEVARDENALDSLGHYPPVWDDVAGQSDGRDSGEIEGASGETGVAGPHFERAVDDGLWTE
jgi:hypothetical protein